ncbi:hypothetical protein [Sinomonas halotolerans]|uniref:Uncharacterized protein n=1 Tax=Sinomonas halotolerans TaxID=1644133 RepID=A0ABU9X0X2_9MICC
MTFDSHPHAVTLKIWDRATLDHTLDEAIAHVSSKANAPREHVRVTRSGPDTFTVSPAEDI